MGTLGYRMWLVMCKARPRPRVGQFWYCSCILSPGLGLALQFGRNTAGFSLALAEILLPLVLSIQFCS